jgi:hypothetical protein
MAPGRCGRISGAGSGFAKGSAKSCFAWCPVARRHLSTGLAKPGAPPAREAGAPAGPPSYAAPYPGKAKPPGQCASSAPLHQVSNADLRQSIVTGRPKPGNGARRREAWLRAVERGRAASPARGVCFPPSCKPSDILPAILKSIVHGAAVSAATDQLKPLRYNLRNVGSQSDTGHSQGEQAVAGCVFGISAYGPRDNGGIRRQCA